MRITPLFPAVAAAIFLLIPARALPDPFERCGLRPAVIVVRGDRRSFDEALAVIEASGARGMQVFPGRAVFARIPDALDETDFTAGTVAVARAPDEVDPADAGPLLLPVLRSLLGGRPAGTGPAGRTGATPDGGAESARIGIRLSEPPPPSAPGREPGPRIGTPAEISDRNHRQNSEFLIGRVVVSIFFPESDGSYEDWTDDEIADALSGIATALSDLQSYANWVELDFILDYEGYLRIPIVTEPAQAPEEEYPLWMIETFAAIGMQTGKHETSAHYINEAARQVYKADWAWVAFVIDASDHGLAAECGDVYMGYATLGGPLSVIPWPSCYPGVEGHFVQAFFQQACVTFWALPENFESPTSCGLPSGYLNVRNYNIESCMNKVPCAMRDAPLTMHFPLCRYSIGQLGLADGNENSVPDLYEVAPEVSVGMDADTLIDGDCYIEGYAWNDAVRNRNPYIDPLVLIDYAPRLSEGVWWLNNYSFDTPITTLDGKWNASQEVFSFLIGGFIPGRNVLHVKVENFVGMSTTVDHEFYYIGLRYYLFSSDSQPDWIDIAWETADETFGAAFDLVREDLTTGTGERVLATVSEPSSSGGGRRTFEYRDEAIEPGHRYRYRVIGRFTLGVGGVVRDFEFPSREITVTALLPVGSRLVSDLVPNPTSGATTMTVNVPQSWYDPTASVESGGRGRLGAPAAREVKTCLDIGVFDVQGRRIATVCEMNLYGGYHSFSWDGTTDRGSPVPPGVYFMRIRAGGVMEVRKVVILR